MRMVRQIIAVSPLQPLLYGSRLLSATGAFRVNRSVDLIGVSLKEGV